MTNPPPRHLVTVWNPAYSADALEAHLRVLLDWDARATAGIAADGDDDVYVWWGKVRSGHRLQPMPHLADILALGDDDATHVPRYYTQSELACDCWFRLRDIRTLVRDDLEGVAAELALLRNTRYHDNPVSIYA